MRPNTHSRTLLYWKLILKWNTIHRFYVCMLYFKSYEVWNDYILPGFQIDLPNMIMKAGRSYWRLLSCNEDRAYKCSVPTAKWIQRVFFFRKGSPWVLYGEPISLRCNNYRRHKNVLCGQNSEFLLLVKDKFSLDHQVTDRNHEAWVQCVKPKYKNREI